MFASFINKFGSTLYVQIWENRIRVIDVETNKCFDEKPLLQIDIQKNGKRQVTAFGNDAYVNPLNPFTHPRALLNDFFIGERLLQEIVKKLIGKKFISLAPAIIIHPMEKTEGGLTMIEIRAFREMALGAGAREVAIHQGKATLAAGSINFKDVAKQEQNLARSSLVINKPLQ
ncbi:rod shape-determining protein [Shewanella marinintestina]|uniref:rod shape-determining protein n=1 Tax=Shewanella marinintestina TaxID=190305 RepID=UPI00200F0181|nr:rod shape-determining protein [Shewanella marinintestina]MCL1148001.1 rod shape-determining protein [Shewanella marinintestina]